MISIHAPLAGSDVLHLVYNKDNKNFYPRSPRGERQVLVKMIITIQNISIHAPLAGSDSKNK